MLVAAPSRWAPGRLVLPAELLQRRLARRKHLLSKRQRQEDSETDTAVVAPPTPRRHSCRTLSQRAQGHRPHGEQLTADLPHFRQAGGQVLLRLLQRRVVHGLHYVPQLLPGPVQVRHRTPRGVAGHLGRCFQVLPTCSGVEWGGVEWSGVRWAGQQGAPSRVDNSTYGQTTAAPRQVGQKRRECRKRAKNKETNQPTSATPTEATATDTDPTTPWPQRPSPPLELPTDRTPYCRHSSALAQDTAASPPVEPVTHNWCSQHNLRLFYFFALL